MLLERNENSQNCVITVKKRK